MNLLHMVKFEDQKAEIPHHMSCTIAVPSFTSMDTIYITSYGSGDNRVYTFSGNSVPHCLVNKGEQV